jgi:hypothetical protein
MANGSQLGSQATVRRLTDDLERYYGEKANA